MDDDASAAHRRLQIVAKANSFNTATSAANRNGHTRPTGFVGGFRPDGSFAEQEEDDEDGEGGDDGEVWGTFADNFRQVQSVLDRNGELIQQVNENHVSKKHDNLVKNVALIQEINGNISKVVSLYSDLSVNFLNVFHQRNGAAGSKNKNGNGDEKTSQP